MNNPGGGTCSCDGWIRLHWWSFYFVLFVIYIFSIGSHLVLNLQKRGDQVISVDERDNHNGMLIQKENFLITQESKNFFSNSERQKKGGKRIFTSTH